MQQLEGRHWTRDPRGSKRIGNSKPKLHQTQLNSPCQTNARVTPSKNGGGQSWETKLKANQVLRGKSLSNTELQLTPSTPKKKTDTMHTSSPLSSDEMTPEIKVSTTPPKSSVSDCKRKLQLETTEVISLLDELDTENLKDDSEDVLITAIEDASTPQLFWTSCE